MDAMFQPYHMKRRVGRKGLIGILPLLAGLQGLKAIRGSGYNRNKNMKKKKSRKGRSMPKLTQKDLLTIARMSGYSRKKGRKGDLDADFLGEFGNLEFEPTKKSLSRQAFEKLKELIGSKAAKEIGKNVVSSGKDYIAEKIKNLGNKKDIKKALTEYSKLTKENNNKGDFVYKNYL